MKRLPLQEEPPPLPPARRSWGWWRCGAAGSGEGQSGHRRRRRGPAPARRAGGRAGARAPYSRPAPVAAPVCHRPGPLSQSGTPRVAPGADPWVCLRPGERPGATRAPRGRPALLCACVGGADLSLRGRESRRARFGETWRGAAGVSRAQCGWVAVPDRRVRARARVEEAATFPERRPRAVPPGARAGDAASPPPVRAEIAARLGAPAAPSDLRRPLPSLPPLGASALSAGPAMERAAGALGDAFSGQVLESRAPGARWDPGVPGSGPRAESPAPRGDCAGAPRPAPEPPPCPGGECPPATPRPEERRALRVRPARASSAPAAPGQPRDSARWMLCVAGAKLKVSGVWARSPEIAGARGTGDWGGGVPGSRGLECPTAAWRSGRG